MSNVETTFKGAFVLATCATPLEVDSVASKHDVNDVNAPGPINRFLETFSMEGTIMTHSSPQAATTIPADDPARNFTLARSDNADLPHIGLVGTILPAKTPPAATVSSTCTFHLAAALHLIAMISKRCSLS